MPPARTSSSTQAKRPRPPFNPPRPRTVAQSDKPQPQKPAASNLARTKASKSSKAAPARDESTSTSRAATKALNHKRPTITLSSDEDSDDATSGMDNAADNNDDDIDDDDDNEDAEVGDTAAHTRQRRTSEATTSNQKQSLADSSRPPPIPQKLLTRLLYESFEDKDMKIGREALAVFGKYMETFVREALARAVYERQDTDGAMGGDGFLQMEDLEKLAPQLLLDF